MQQPAATLFPAQSHDHGRCIADALDGAEALCTRRGARLTTLRRRVLELVWERHEPVRAYDILDSLRAGRPGAAPPTVYRALDFLLGHGLIHRIESLNAYVGCGEPRASHTGQFLICDDCGAVGEIDDAEISGLIAEKADAMGFAVLRQTVEVMGRCPGCAADSGDA